MSTYNTDNSEDKKGCQCLYWDEVPFLAVTYISGTDSSCLSIGSDQL